ncbi:hypothetical protein PIB30_071536 [Stylosanthes scabra]|uniref:Uncharacterized protein n=1 Tax=Stylosanthes scabra TaxID=79078 RepID=A0ABU6TNG8_9FABA|nr:hypothetical protein [Stylosanthes scabra]
MASSNDNEAWKKGGRPRNPDDWIVQQELFLHLASKFDLENNLIKDDVGNIEVNTVAIERATGLPSYGANFPEYDPDDIHTAALKLKWEWGQLDRYRGSEPWFAQWTASMLDLRAASTLKKKERKRVRERAWWLHENGGGDHYSPTTSRGHNFRSGAPIDAPFAPLRSLFRPL